MRLIRLLILAAGAAYLYKRFLADPGAGRAETQAAEPFSSEQLGEDDAKPAEPAATPAEAPKDTLERPTWLDPADAG